MLQTLPANLLVLRYRDFFYCEWSLYLDHYSCHEDDTQLIFSNKFVEIIENIDREFFFILNILITLAYHSEYIRGTNAMALFFRRKSHHLLLPHTLKIEYPDLNYTSTIHQKVASTIFRVDASISFSSIIILSK